MAGRQPRSNSWEQSLAAFPGSIPWEQPLGACVGPAFLPPTAERGRKKQGVPLPQAQMAIHSAEPVPPRHPVQYSCWFGCEATPSRVWRYGR